MKNIDSKLFSLLLLLLINILSGQTVWAQKKTPLSSFRASQEHFTLKLMDTKYTLGGLSFSMLIPKNQTKNTKTFISLLYSYGKSNQKKIKYNNISLQYLISFFSKYIVRPNLHVGISKFMIKGDDMDKDTNYGMTIGAGFEAGSSLTGFFFDPIKVAYYKLHNEYPLVYSSNLGIYAKF